jgi:hypothetical protein
VKRASKEKQIAPGLATALAGSSSLSAMLYLPPRLHVDQRRAVGHDPLTLRAFASRASAAVRVLHLH